VHISTKPEEDGESI